MAAAMASATSLGCSTKGFRAVARAPRASSRMVVRAAAANAEVPDMNKRVTMNWLLAGAIGAPVAGLAGPYALFFVPPS